MDNRTRAELATRALAGYPHGPGASQVAIDRARKRIETCEAIVIVEGICDQIAVETLARRQGRDLAAEGVVVFPVGGAQAALSFLREYGPSGERLDIAGLCDEDAVDTLRSALHLAGIGAPRSIGELATFGFHVCARDLEDELIRAVGTDEVEAAIESQGDLSSFRTFLKQPNWRGRDRVDQLRRFLASKSRRSQRYARVLLEAVEPDRAPAPLQAVLADV